MTLETQDSLTRLKDLVEDLRQGRDLDNERANLINFTVDLETDDAILANRAIARGADPFAIQYLAYGEVEPHIRTAHFQGPGNLHGPDKDDWLFLAALSTDEHATKQTLRERLFHLMESVETYKLLDGSTQDSHLLQRQRLIDAEQERIKSLPFTRENVGGQEMRLYTADLGFAAGYWSGEDFCAVRANDGLTFVGSKEHSLADLGIEVHKVLSPTFGIIFPPEQE